MQSTPLNLPCGNVTLVAPGGGVGQEGAAFSLEALCGAHNSAHMVSLCSSVPSTLCGLAAWRGAHVKEQLVEPSPRAGTMLHPPWIQPIIPLGGF